MLSIEINADRNSIASTISIFPLFLLDRPHFCSVWQCVQTQVLNHDQFKSVVTILSSNFLTSFADMDDRMIQFWLMRTKRSHPGKLLEKLLLYKIEETDSACVAYLFPQSSFFECKYDV